MTDSDTIEELATQSSITFFGNITRTLAGFLLVVVATRTLGSDLYGVFVIAFSVASVLLGVTNLKIFKAIDYFVPQHLANESYQEAKGTIINVLGIAILGAVIGATLLIVFPSLLGRFFDDSRLITIIPVLSLLLPLRSVNQVLFALFTSIKRMDYRVSVEYILIPIVKLGTFILLFHFGLEVFSLVFGYVIATAIGVAVSLIIIYRHVTWITEVSAQYPIRRRLIGYSAPLALAGIVTTMLGQIDYILIGYFLESDSVGVYRVGYELGTGLIIVLTAVTPIFKPMIAEVIGDTNQIGARYALATRWIIILTFPVFVTLVLAPKVYLRLLFTSEFAVGWPVVVILAVGYLINAVSGPEGMVLEGLGYTRITFLNSILMLIVNVGLGILLIPRFGIAGAAVATAAAIGLSASAGVLEVWYFERVLPYDLSSVKLVLSGILLYLIFLPVVEQLPSELHVAITLPVLTPIIYLLLIRVVGGFSPEDQHIATLIDNKLGRQVFTWIVSN